MAHNRPVPKHFEDALAKDYSFRDAETEMGCALGAKEPFNDTDGAWEEEVYGKELAARHRWLRHEDVGGKTFKFGR